MTWLLIAIGAYLLNAVASLIDKFLLKKAVSEPAVYAFFVSILGLFALAFSPFDLRIPPLFVIFVSIAAGLLFVLALYLFFTALKKSEASTAVPVVGSLTPIFVLFFAFFILNETLSINQIIAFVLILAGNYFISKESEARGKFSKQLIILCVLAGFFFGLSHVLSKYVYIHQSFAGGIAWRSLGQFLGGLIIFLIPKNRKDILSDMRNPQVKTDALFITGQVMGAASFVLVNYAFSIGSIAIVNALAGFQYIFLFLMIAFLSKKFSRVLNEPGSLDILKRRFWSILLMAAGVALLFT